NSEVKPFSADDSVAVCHAKVGNCQALKSKTQAETLGFFFGRDLVVGWISGSVTQHFVRLCWVG
ncbi:MAG: hypothetical protein M0Q44_21725, partial [Methylobacter sp.]|nr:hypothetical protein [Methylobacter sp.]